MIPRQVNLPGVSYNGLSLCSTLKFEYFNPLISGPGRFEWWKSRKSPWTVPLTNAIFSWDCPFKPIQSKCLIIWIDCTQKMFCFRFPETEDCRTRTFRDPITWKHLHGASPPPLPPPSDWCPPPLPPPPPPPAKLQNYRPIITATQGTRQKGPRKQRHHPSSSASASQGRLSSRGPGGGWGGGE